MRAGNALNVRRKEKQGDNVRKSSLLRRPVSSMMLNLMLVAAFMAMLQNIEANAFKVICMVRLISFVDDLIVLPS